MNCRCSSATATALLLLWGLASGGCRAERVARQHGGVADLPGQPPKSVELILKRISPEGVEASDPQWSPGGRELAFTVWKTQGTRETGEVKRAAGFWVASTATRQVVRRVPGIFLTWCDEKTLLWQDEKVQQMDVHSGRSGTSVIQGTRPLCSPQGGKIAVQQGSTTRRRLVVIDRQDASTSYIARASETFESFTYQWSPSGRYLTVADWKPHGFGSQLAWVRVFTPTGRLVRELAGQICGSAQGGFVSWTPDEKQVVYGARSGERCELYALALRDGGSPSLLARLSEPDVWGVRVSPDGQWVTYAAGSRPVADLHPRYGRVHLLNLSTRHVSTLMQQPEEDAWGHGATWSPDSRHLAYAVKGAVYLATISGDGRDS